MMVTPIQEALLHYVWRTKRWDIQDLLLTDGRPLDILSFGIPNHDAGPDFLEGHIRIDGIQWHGQIEMHVQASDWNLHGHQHDPRYDNVILHVVYDHNADIYRSDGTIIPTLVIDHRRISSQVINQYTHLIQSERWIPCADLVRQVDGDFIGIYLDRLVAHRLAEKASLYALWLREYQGDWETVLYIAISRALGLKVNADAMEALAQAVPLSVIQKNSHDPDMVIAILYGQAGLLQSGKDPISETWQKSYDFAKHKYNLQSIPQLLWKYSRMRPSAFPTIRIAQWAAIYLQESHLMQFLRDASTAEDIKQRLEVTAHSYWDTRFVFGPPVHDKKPKKLGKATVDLLLINAIAPMLYLYGDQTGDITYVDKAIDLLYNTQAEKNQITNGFSSLGINARHAADSQALVHLKHQYCDPKQCLQCSIGDRLLRSV